MTFSLNEIESMGKRAARGARLSWGLAEEAGKAARWLAERGEPGPETLADCLARIDGRTYDDFAPVMTDGLWRARSGTLCPLVSGPALSDRAAEIAGGTTMVFDAMAHPLFLAPYAAAVAKQIDGAVTLAWNGVTLTVTTTSLVAIDGCRDAVVADTAKDVRCTRATHDRPMTPALIARRCAVDPDAWRRLETFAQRTFAPATDESRLADAGAGLEDND